MKICDICKSNNAGYDTYAVIKDDGTTKELELCGHCWRELRHRENLHRYQAYEETVKAVGGEIPHKFRWWYKFTW